MLHVYIFASTDHVIIGIYSFSENEPIVLKAGVSLHADDEQPTIFVGPEGNSTATISGTL